MTTIINTKLGIHRGKKRLWLEGTKLQREGITPGAKFNLVFRESKMIISVCDEGQFTVSRRESNGKVSPIIDVMVSEMAALFEGIDMLRVSIRKGTLIVSAHQYVGKIIERVETLKKKLSSGLALSVCSLFHGGGVLDKAIHSGLAGAGVESFVEVVVEIEKRYLESSLRNNPELWSDKTVVIESPIEWINVSGNTLSADVLIAGIPCTGASRAGKSKNKLAFAELHESAGAYFFYFLNFIVALNPGIVIIENVPEYANTASMAVIRSVLETFGYTLQERILEGNEFGALEKRKRLCVVAITHGLGDAFAFDLNGVLPLRKKENCLANVLEPIAPDSNRWKSFDYLADKELRDKAAGKGFARQLLTGAESSCGVIGKSYAKCRSTEPFIVSPCDPTLSRLLTPSEHAKVKAIPLGVIDGLSDTIAHEVLGQSVIYPAFEALGKALGEWMRCNLVAEKHDPVLSAA